MVSNKYQDMDHVAGESADNGIKAFLRQSVGVYRRGFVVNTDNDIVVERCDPVDGKQVIREITRSKDNCSLSKSSVVSGGLIF